MSTSATASGRDWTPSDESNLKNQMCLLVLTRQDGTPFNATSLSEEDIVEICIRQGHTHPMGVLCYLAMELVALFCSTQDMQHTTCRAIKAMVLQDESIAIRAMAPSETHIRAYMKAIEGDPSKPQPPPSEEEGNPSPTDNSHPSGETHNVSKWSLATSLTMNCISSWRISARRLHSMNWMHHRSPPTMPWGHPSGSRNPNEDDQEVTFLRRGGWVPLGKPSVSPALAWPDGGWAPQGPPPQTQIPAQPNPDVGHLINTLASGLHLGTLRINTFSSEAMPGKTKVLFKQWNHDVQCVKDHYPESVVQESIMRSLKGAVADIAWYMGPTTSVSNILQKLSHFQYSGIF